MIDSVGFRGYSSTVQKFIDEAVEEALSVKYQDGESTDVHSFMDALIKETREPRVLRDQLLNVMLAGQENAKEDEISPPSLERRYHALAPWIVVG